MLPIIARSLEIPAISGINDITTLVQQREHEVLEGTTGELVIVTWHTK
jgi:phosphoenolpyruvate-protein kinase (PTS system EI component)